MSKPSVGRIVHTIVNAVENNGSDVAPAVITRVWSDSMVNLKVLLDGHTDKWLTSVPLYAARSEVPQPQTFGCWWPERVG